MLSHGKEGSRQDVPLISYVEIVLEHPGGESFEEKLAIGELWCGIHRYAVPAAHELAILLGERVGKVPVVAERIFRAVCLRIHALLAATGCDVRRHVVR